MRALFARAHTDTDMHARAPVCSLVQAGTQELTTQAEQVGIELQATKAALGVATEETGAVREEALHAQAELDKVRGQAEIEAPKATQAEEVSEAGRRGLRTWARGHQLNEE